MDETDNTDFSIHRHNNCFDNLKKKMREVLNKTMQEGCDERQMKQFYELHLWLLCIKRETLCWEDIHSPMERIIQ